MLGGTWRLVYSSGFASGSLGGLRPGPQAALLPVTIGQVLFCTSKCLHWLLFAMQCGIVSGVARSFPGQESLVF